jgi:hypothetical protein
MKVGPFALVALASLAVACESKPNDWTGPYNEPSDAGADADPAAPAFDFTGRWAMFVSADAWAIDVAQAAADGSLTGLGCPGSLPPATDPAAPLCGLLTGTVRGREARFSFTSDKRPFFADVIASVDGKRLGGEFSAGDVFKPALTSWRAIGATDKYLAVTAPAGVSDAVATRARVSALTGTSPPELASRGALSVELLVLGAQPWLRGDLGSFAPDELAWDEATQTLTAGPVVATAPKLPTKLVLTFDGATLKKVDATMPSGKSYAFDGPPASAP